MTNEEREIFRLQKALQFIADLPPDVVGAARIVAVKALQRLRFHGYDFRKVKKENVIQVCNAIPRNKLRLPEG